MHPTRNADLESDVLGTKFVVLVRAVLVAFCHVILESLARGPTLALALRPDRSLYALGSG
jgi:hypothetical protein